MRSSRVRYLPTASIVVGVVILAVAVGAVSFRDIARGRRQVAEVLHREALATVRFMAAAFRADLLAPSWHWRRLDLFFENAGGREQIAYIAVLGPGGKILAHSDPDRLGETWPSALQLEVDSHTGLTRGEFVSVDGQRVFQLAAILDVSASGVATPMARRIGRRPPRPIIPDILTIVDRLSDLLQRPVDPGETVLLTAVVGLDSSDLEAAFLASRNHTIMMSGILLVAGGAAIYFLFVLAGYRSAQTALANMRSYTTNVIESMASGLVSVDADGCVVTVNSRARELLALGGGNVKGRPLSDVLVVDPSTGSVDMGSVVRGERDLLETEATIVVDGVGLPVVLSASSLLDENGRRSGGQAPRRAGTSRRGRRPRGQEPALLAQGICAVPEERIPARVRRGTLLRHHDRGSRASGPRRAGASRLRAAGHSNASAERREHHGRRGSVTRVGGRRLPER